MLRAREAQGKGCDSTVKVRPVDPKKVDEAWRRKSGFKLEAEYEGMMGWHNDKTLFWIAAADAKGRKHKYRKGDIGFHHYAFRLRSRKDVDALQAVLKDQGTTIVDPAGDYYDDYYAVFFLDPDGMKLEGMRYGERHEQAARKRAAKKKARARKK